MIDSPNEHDGQFLGDTMPEFNLSFFAEIPAFVFQGLTAEQIRSKGQLYQVAYEKSRESSARKAADRKWMVENGMAFGDGI